MSCYQFLSDSDVHRTVRGRVVKMDIFKFGQKKQKAYKTKTFCDFNQNEILVSPKARPELESLVNPAYNMPSCCSCPLLPRIEQILSRLPASGITKHRGEREGTVDEILSSKIGNLE